MVYIKKVETRGFKSFGLRPVNVNFEGQFIGITGPNGSGKSNIVDAILFAIGENKPRMMRVPKLSGLIFDGAGGTPSTSARVTLTLDNTSRDLSIDNDRVTLTREIQSSGDSIYLLNGKKIQKGTLSELLRLALISSDGLNFVPQGMVTHLAELESNEKRALIEEIVGVAEFDEKKDDALKQLDGADRKLEIAMARIGEVKKNIDSLEGERNDQLRLQYLDKERGRLKSIMIAQKLNDVKNSIEENNQLLVQVSQENKKLNEELNNKNKQINTLDTEKQSTLTQVIDGASDDLLSVQIELSKKTEELKKHKTTELEFRTDINKISESLPYLKDMLSENSQTVLKTKENIQTISTSLKDSKTDLEKLNDKMKICDLKRKSLTDSTQAEEKLLTTVNKQLRQSYDDKNHISGLLSKNIAQKSVLQEKLSAAEKKQKETQVVVNVISKSISELDSLQSAEHEYLSNMTNSNTKLANRREKIESELSKAITILTKANEQVLKHESKVEAAKEITSRQNVQSKIKAIAKENSISGCLGGIDDIFDYPDRYKVALQAAAKRWSNAVIVDEITTLLQIVTLIKKHKLGRVALIPLSDVVDFERTKAPKNKDILGSLADFLEVDDKYTGILNFIFGDILLVSSAKTGYMWSQKGYRTVSISGDLFEPGGSVFETGSVSPLANLFFDSKSLIQIKSSVTNLRNSIQKRKTVITSLNSEVKAIELGQNDRKLSIERLISELKNMKNMKDRYVDVISKIETNQNELHKKLTECLTIILKQEKELKDINDLIKTQKDKIDSRSSLQSLKKDLESLETERNMLSDNVNSVSDTIRNNETTLTREQANLEHNLEMQKNQLTKQISDLESELKDKNQFLDDSNSILPELKTTVDTLTSQENLLSDKSRKMKLIIDELDKQIKSLNKEKEIIQKNLIKNTSKSHNIESHTSRLIDSQQSYRDNLNELGYNESISYFFGADVLVTELDKEYNNLRSRVNLLADEQYRDIYSGYKGFSERKNQLQKERTAIVDFINSIDSEKHTAFLDAFKIIDQEFRNLFAKLTTSDSSYCNHDNCPPSRILHGDAWLDFDNPDDIFTAGITLMAKFPNKVERDIVICSGGEKTVAALCLILAIQAVKPAPFYVFDEIDAHLDAVNSSKLAEIIRSRTDKSQIIMVSLKDTILSRVDNMYGVYHERGITKILKYQPKEMNKEKEIIQKNLIKNTSKSQNKGVKVR